MFFAGSLQRQKQVKIRENLSTASVGMAWWKWVIAGAGVGFLILKKMFAGGVFRGKVSMLGTQ